MIRAGKVIFAATCVAITASPAMTAAPAITGAWGFRPGLYDFAGESQLMVATLPANLVEEGKKYSESHPSPDRQERQLCIRDPNWGYHLVALLDPAGHPAGACTETVVSETSSDREVEIVCSVPAPVQGMPMQAVHGRYHLVLTGSGPALADSVDVDWTFPGLTMKEQYHWHNADCGDVR